MAVLVSTLNATTIKDIADTVYDQVLKHNPVLYRFWRKGPKKSGGAAMTWPILKQAKNFGGSYAGADSLAHGTEDTGAPAEVPWRHYYEDVTIPRTDLLKARGVYAKVDLLRFKFDEAILNLRQRVSADLYMQASGIKALDNLFMAIDDGTEATTYAGIAHSNPYWKPGMTGLGRVSKAGAVAALSELEALYSECSDGDEQPTLMVGTPKAEQFIWGQLQSLQRYTRDEEMTKAGFENFKFNRAVFVTDRNIIPAFAAITAANGGVLFLNENWIDLVSHEEEDFGIDPIIPGLPSERSINTKCVWTGNLRVKTPRYNGKLVNVTNF
jgi:hypothetical protein